MSTAVSEMHGCPLVDSLGQQVLFVPRDRWSVVLGALRGEGWEMCADLTAVDYLQHPGRSLPEGVVAERFEVVANLLSVSGRGRLRARTQVPETDATLASVFGLYPGTEAMEREVWDMFGIAFDGHPDLTRILMPEDWDGHPLRKDFSQGRIPVQFKGAPS